MQGIDLNTFWQDSEYARREYVGAPVTVAMIESVQAELGYQLPQAYLQLLHLSEVGVILTAVVEAPDAGAADEALQCGARDVMMWRHRQHAQSPVCLKGLAFAMPSIWLRA